MFDIGAEIAEFLFDTGAEIGWMFDTGAEIAGSLFDTGAEIA